jgi:hypothetical protein
MSQATPRIYFRFILGTCGRWAVGAAPAVSRDCGRRGRRWDHREEEEDEKTRLGDNGLGGPEANYVSGLPVTTRNLDEIGQDTRLYQ